MTSSCIAAQNEMNGTFYRFKNCTILTLACLTKVFFQLSGIPYHILCWVKHQCQVGSACVKKEALPDFIIKRRSSRQDMKAD